MFCSFCFFLHSFLFVLGLSVLTDGDDVGLTAFCPYVPEYVISHTVNHILLIAIGLNAVWVNTNGESVPFFLQNCYLLARISNHIPFCT